MAEADATLVQQFLHVSLAERKAVVEPERVTDHAERKSVSVGLLVSHGLPNLSCQNPQP